MVPYARTKEQFEKNTGIRSVPKPLSLSTLTVKNLKAKAIEDIRKYYNIDKKHTIAFGDGNNDLEMLLEVNYGVAMGNSSKLLLNNAKYKTKTIKEHGVKAFFESFDFKE